MAKQSRARATDHMLALTEHIHYIGLELEPGKQKEKLADLLCELAAELKVRDIHKLTELVLLAHELGKKDAH